MASHAGASDSFDSESNESPRFSFYFTLLQLTALSTPPDNPISGYSAEAFKAGVVDLGWMGVWYSRRFVSLVL